MTTDLEKFINENITLFHEARIKSLEKLKLNDVLKRKNPYLYKAKDMHTAAEIVQNITDAFLSSQEETLFGEFLEKLAIFICGVKKGGYKSGIEGIDLEYNENGKRVLVSIKSGPNWGNSSQIKKMQDNFTKAKKILHTQNRDLEIVCINGCCYGRDNHPDKGDYQKLCGQLFWKELTGDPEFYQYIITAVGYRAKAKNENFKKKYNAVLNKFTKEFLNSYCLDDGEIDWQKLVKFNSGSEICK